ncbi:MAG: HyaD/HybD family hydrogenase maturation endopeptidase [Desulfobaccales bacterium]
MKPHISLIGLGNILMQDEGVGVHAVKAILKDYALPPNLNVVDGGTAGLDLLPFIEGRDRVLFVDAVNFRQEPGYIGVLRNQEIPVFFSAKHSLHHIGLADVLAAAQLLNLLPPEVCLIGLQPHTIALGLELTPLIQARLQPLIARIIEELQDWGLSLTPNPG